MAIATGSEGGEPTSSAWERLRFLLGRTHWWPLAAAPLLATAIAGGVTTGWYTPTKLYLEDLALLLLGFFALLCLLRFALSKELYFLWAAAVLATLLGRELRFGGFADLVYLLLPLLGWIGLRHFEAFQHRLAHPVLLSALALGFFIYALSVMVDQRWTRRLPAEAVWHVPLEETLEVVGHAILGVALVLSPPTCAGRARAAAGGSSR